MSREFQQAANAYILSINHALTAGKTSEHTHRPAIIEFIKWIDPSLTLQNDPGLTAGVGKPDIVVQRGATPIGLIETKDIGVDLDMTESGEQMGRYRQHPNLLLTEYIEFRWYRDGQFRQRALWARPGKEGRWESFSEDQLDADPKPN